MILRREILLFFTFLLHKSICRALQSTITATTTCFSTSTIYTDEPRTSVISATTVASPTTTKVKPNPKFTSTTVNYTESAPAPPKDLTPATSRPHILPIARIPPASGDTSSERGRLSNHREHRPILMAHSDCSSVHISFPYPFKLISHCSHSLNRLIRANIYNLLRRHSCGRLIDIDSFHIDSCVPSNVSEEQSVSASIHFWNLPANMMRYLQAAVNRIFPTPIRVYAALPTGKANLESRRFSCIPLKASELSTYIGVVDGFRTFILVCACAIVTIFLGYSYNRWCMLRYSSHV